MNPWKSPELSFRRRHLPHLEVPDATYFVSFSCRNRLELPPEARDLVMAEIRALDDDAIDLDAMVVMPDHVHAIFRLIGTLTLIQILKRIKGRTAHRINQITGRQRQVWTQESFDHIVRSESKRQEKIEYVRNNPLKKGLVSSPADYRWLYIRMTEFIPSGKEFIPSDSEFIPSDKNREHTKSSAKNKDSTK